MARKITAASGGYVAWGGFLDGKLHWFAGKTWPDAPSRPTAAIYLTRREARKEYEDVRKIVITEVK